MIIKPDENFLFHKISEGGLGLTNVKLKAKSCFIKTFLDLSINAKYISSPFLAAIYEHHVLNENVHCPPLPPYLNEDIFQVIRTAKHCDLIVEDMTIKDWYSFLMDQEFTSIDPLTQLNVLKPCKVELNFQYSDWYLIWHNCRLSCFDSEMSSFSFKLVHDLLPTDERLSRFLPNNSSLCKYCTDSPSSDHLHVFFLCSLSCEVGGWLLRVVREIDPTATPDAILRLEISGGDALLWLTVYALLYIWRQRSKKKRAVIEDFTSMCRTDLDVLSLTKHSYIAMLAKIHDMGLKSWI